MANQFDPVPACFSGVQFLPVSRVQRIVFEKLARFERETGRKAEFPIDIETLVEVVEKIEVEYISGDSQYEAEVLGAYDFTQGKMLVREAFDHEGRRRFTWAHEYGHFVLHGPHFLQQVFDFFAQEPNGAIQLNRGAANSRNKLEWQANTFASHLLMPDHLVSHHFGNLRSSDTSETLVSILASAALVSKQAARIRLQQMGWIPASDH